MTSGSTLSKRGSASDVGNGNGSATLSGNLLLTSQGSPSSGTLKKLGREAGRASHGEGPSSKNGMSWQQVKWKAQNRVHWRKTVEALCSKRSGED